MQAAAGNHRSWIGLLARKAEHRSYPWWVALIAFLCTLTALAPFGVILTASVLFKPQRWREIVVLSGAGAAFASVILFTGFTHLPWETLLHWFPALGEAERVALAQRWIGEYGAWALLAIAASPLPQTPALLVCSLAALPVWQVFVAMLCGKWLKYALYAASVMKVRDGVWSRWLGRTSPPPGSAP